MNTRLLRVSQSRRSKSSTPARVGGLPLECWLKEYLSGLPLISGGPISLEFRTDLTAHRGKLLSRQSDQGTPVYAASFLPQRRVVVESSLATTPAVLRLILTHELFHFVWWRIGNHGRLEFNELIENERVCGARGELGESAGVAKDALKRAPSSNPRLWKHYVCEAFCDTAAWLYSGVPRHPQFVLAPRWCAERRRWFASRPMFRT